MGIEKSSFGALAMAGTTIIVAKAWWGIPLVFLLYFLARWQTKQDDQFLAVFLKYLNEEHVYDAIPRLKDYQTRPKGWGKGLPL